MSSLRWISPNEPPVLLAEDSFGGLWAFCLSRRCLSRVGCSAAIRASLSGAPFPPRPRPRRLDGVSADRPLPSLASVWPDWPDWPDGEDWASAGDPFLPPRDLPRPPRERRRGVPPLVDPGVDRSVDRGEDRPRPSPGATSLESDSCLVVWVSGALVSVELEVKTRRNSRRAPRIPEGLDPGSL